MRRRHIHKVECMLLVDAENARQTAEIGARLSPINAWRVRLSPRLARPLCCASACRHRLIIGMVQPVWVIAQQSEHNADSQD
jgi:hypothetical protein